jgi:hypothetical protein
LDEGHAELVLEIRDPMGQGRPADPEDAGRRRETARLRQHRKRLQASERWKHDLSLKLVMIGEIISPFDASANCYSQTALDEAE